MTSLTDSLVDFEFDHVGIAVKNIAETAEFYRALGLGQMYQEEVPSEKVRVAMFDLANSSRVELLEPTDSESPVGKFLDKRGPGLHHICLRVKDIRAAMARLKANGARLINEEPRPGAHNCLVAFVHPSSTGGVLLELSEPQGN